MAGQGLGVQRAELGEHGEQQVGGSRSGTADEQDGEDAEAGDQHPPAAAPIRVMSTPKTLLTLAMTSLEKPMSM